MQVWEGLLDLEDGAFVEPVSQLVDHDVHAGMNVLCEGRQHAAARSSGKSYGT